MHSWLVAQRCYAPIEPLPESYRATKPMMIRTSLSLSGLSPFGLVPGGSLLTHSYLLALCISNTSERSSLSELFRRYCPAFSQTKRKDYCDGQEDFTR